MYIKSLYVQIPDSAWAAAAMKSLTVLVSGALTVQKLSINLIMRKKNYFVNEQFCSREAVQFFQGPVVPC